MIKNIKIKDISTTIELPDKLSGKLAILLPGYLDSKDYNHLKFLSNDLTKIEYIVIRFNPTGTWDSGGSIENYSVTQYLADLANVVEYAMDNHSIEEITLLGHSLGGQIAMLFAFNNPKVKDIFGIMPAYDPMKAKSVREVLPLWKEKGVRVSKRDLPDQSGDFVEYAVKYSFLLDRANYKTLENLKKFKGRTMLIAGELDNVIEPATVKEIYAAANEPKKYIAIPDVGHDYRHDLQKIRAVNDLILNELNSL